MRLPAYLRHPVTATVARWGRIPGLRTAKATLAVVAAYLLAEVLHLSEHPIVAPLMALLVVQLTLYKTLMHGLGRVGGVLAGVLVAVGVANVAGLTWWSLGAVVAGSLVVGRLLRLGPHLFEAPITAMLLLEVSAGGALALTRVAEALLGALVGITVSVLVAPPLYLQPAGEAIGELAERMANFARNFADGLRGPWSRSAADHWLTQARGVRDEVLRADLTVARVEESARLHPHARRSRDAQPQLRSTLTGLERCHLTLRTLARAVLDRTYFMPLAEESAAYTSEQRAALADLLATAAAAIDSVIPIATGTDPDAARLCVEAHLAELDDQRHRINTLLTVDAQTDQAAWKQHGALLASSTGSASRSPPPHANPRRRARRSSPLRLTGPARPDTLAPPREAPSNRTTPVSPQMELVRRGKDGPSGFHGYLPVLASGIRGHGHRSSSWTTPKSIWPSTSPTTCWPAGTFWVQTCQLPSST